MLLRNRPFLIEILFVHSEEVFEGFFFLTAIVDEGWEQDQQLVRVLEGAFGFLHDFFRQYLGLHLIIIQVYPADAGNGGCEGRETRLREEGPRSEMSGWEFGRTIINKFRSDKFENLLNVILMKQTAAKTNKTNSKSIPMNTGQKTLQSKQASGKNSKQKGATGQKYKINAITKDNYDIVYRKDNITEIGELNLKYVLKCIDGLYKNRFIFITTHPDGEVFGEGDAKLYGLTLQIEGVALAKKHAQLKYDGFKSFMVRDFGSESGTWMNISTKGVAINHGDKFALGNHEVTFEEAEEMNEIEEICIVYHVDYLCEVLEFNGFHSLKELREAYEEDNFEGYPFDKKEKEKLGKMCRESSKWYQEGKTYRRLNMIFTNQPLKDLSLEIGWETLYVAGDPEFIFTDKNHVAQVSKGRLVPVERVFTKIPKEEDFPLSLHSQIKIGSLSFEMTRFNSGSALDIGYRSVQEDGILIQEDIGGSEWKLISLFAVLDGHGGVECMKFVKDNLVRKIREWTPLLDEAGDLNEMVRVLMNKTFYELDHEFYKKDPDVAQTCGATALVVLIIQKRVYAFHVGDCKGFLFRQETLFQMNVEHTPGRGDERVRIESAGGFVQFDKLMGKCSLSRCMGQFEYKELEDYANEMKGKAKSYLSCLPELRVFDIQVEGDEFILLSTDGMLDSMSIHKITDHIKEKYEKLGVEENPNRILGSLMETCKISNLECDNMAAILIIIRGGEAK